MDTSGMTSETALSSYSLFRSIGSEPTHLWSQPLPATLAAGGHHKTSFGDRTHSSGHKSGANSDPDLDQLFVFGYSCKLFRDDRRAREMDSGQHLIGWNGSTDHLIDRFDVRGCLSDLSEFDANRRQCAQQLSAEELEMERMCDEERYADLNNHYIDDNHDEEIKRLHLALADGSGYSQINYNYDENNAPTSQLTEELTCEAKLTTIEDSDRFKLPTGLSPPEDISLPESQKLHHIIEKTALFVSKHGIQMEIILKTKQSANKNFDFLSFESQLYSYYKYILEAIKSGKYIPNQNKGSDNSDDSDDDSDGDNYLHPSLLGSSSAKANNSRVFNIPNLLRVQNNDNNDDSYSQLVKSFKDRFPVAEEPVEEAQPIPQTKTFVPIDCESIKAQNKDKAQCVANQLLTTSWSSILPSPPPDIEQIIEKLAQRVAINGEQFEASIKKLGETRFEFVNPGHKYHAHYIRRKLHYLDENRKSSVAQLKLSNSHKPSKNTTKSKPHESRHKTPVSFSINSKSEFKSTAPNDENALKAADEVLDSGHTPDISAKRVIDNALKDKLALAVRDRAAKDKQLERKRKAALFITLMKNKSKEQTKTSESTESVVTTEHESGSYGPELPKCQTQANSAPLSPTICAVTSPNASPTRDGKNSDNSLLDAVLSHKTYETAKSGSLLPFIVSDKPLKDSSRLVSSSSSHRSKSRHSSYSHKKSHKRKRSKSRSRSPSRSSRTRRNRHSSKSRSRSRSRSHSRSHRRH